MLEYETFTKQQMETQNKTKHKYKYKTIKLILFKLILFKLVPLHLLQDLMCHLNGKGMTFKKEEFVVNFFYLRMRLFANQQCKFLAFLCLCEPARKP